MEFLLPDIGEGVAEGEIVKWHVGPGDREHDLPPSPTGPALRVIMRRLRAIPSQSRAWFMVSAME